MVQGSFKTSAKKIDIEIFQTNNDIEFSDIHSDFLYILNSLDSVKVPVGCQHRLTFFLFRKPTRLASPFIVLLHVWNLKIDADPRKLDSLKKN